MTTVTASSSWLSLTHVEPDTVAAAVDDLTISTCTTLSATPVLGEEGVGRSPTIRFIRELLPERGGPTKTHCMMVLFSDPFCLIASSRAAKCPSSDWDVEGRCMEGEGGRREEEWKGEQEGMGGKGGIKVTFKRRLVRGEGEREGSERRGGVESEEGRGYMFIGYCMTTDLHMTSRCTWDCNQLSDLMQPTHVIALIYLSRYATYAVRRRYFEDPYSMSTNMLWALENITSQCA